MRKFTSKFSLTAALAFAIILTIGCDDAVGQSALVDHWLYLSGRRKPMDIELFKDGTGVCDGSSVSWKVENKRFILLSPLNGLASDYKLSGSKLTLIYNNGDSTVFAKKADYEKEKKKMEAEIEKAKEAAIKDRARQKRMQDSIAVVDARAAGKTVPSRLSDKNALNLSVVLDRNYFEIWGRGGSLPKIFFKEHKGSSGDIELWTLHKESEEDPGKIEMSVYSKSDSAYLDSDNEFITQLSAVVPGSTVATLSESSVRRLACGRSAPGVEDICSDGKPAIKLKPRSAYDELAKLLIMIHNRFIDSPDANSIIILADDDIDISKIILTMQRAREAGFYKIKIQSK